MVRPSPAPVFGAIVGAGLRAATGCLTWNRVKGWVKALVGGLGGVLGSTPPPPPPEMKCPALLRARALSPLVATSRPALVRRPIFIISRLLNCAAIISRLFFWAS